MIEELYNIFNHYKEKHDTHTIYGLFDGVKYPMLWSDLEDGSLLYDMLFHEEALRKEMEKVAPFLVALDFDSEIGMVQTKELLQSYGNNGSIFMSSELEFMDVLSSMRELFYVYTPEGEKGYMRFYEPKIFTSYIKQKDPNIRYALFSNMHSYWCEGDNNTLRQYSIENAKDFREKIFNLGEEI